MKKLISLLLIAALLVFLCMTNPTSSEFAAWYTSQIDFPETGTALDDALSTFTEYLAARAERTDYLIFSIFSHDGHKTLGIGLKFYPVDSLSEQLDTIRTEYAEWLTTNTD